MRYLQVVLLLVFLAACNGSEAPGTTGTGFPESTASKQYAFTDLNYSHTPISDLQGTGWSVVVKNGPSWLQASIDGSAVKLSGIPDESGKTYSEVEIVATKGSSSKKNKFKLVVQGDLLRAYQWPLKNDGDSSFSRDAGLLGEDMKVIPVWQKNVMGSGVKVGVSDSGVEVGHADLKANMLSGEHRNYRDGSASNGYKGTPETFGEAHGTAVSGIIAAVGWNDIGVTGVAPKAQVAGFQFLDSLQSTEIMLHQASGVFDVFNYSYGSGLNVDMPNDDMYMAQLRDRARNGRNGKGQIFVKSAGNEFSGFCGMLNGNEVCAPQNANIPADNNSPFLIVVGATAASGETASYSNAGSNVWVSAPGGEDGDELPAIVSTDLSSCAQGFSKTTGLWDFNLFESLNNSSLFKTFNPKCDYTSMMNGTSSAAPHTTGVVALLLSANPNLGWRDVKHILAKTADKLHPELGPKDHYEPALRLPGYVYEQGWVTNAAGYAFHNWYGFGRINAKRAVEMAQNNYVPLPNWSESNPDFNIAAQGESGLAVAIPDASPAGAQRSLNFSQSKIVETVQVKVKVFHNNSGQVGVELTSPSGTKSILLNINNALFVPAQGRLSPDKDLNVVLTSNAFYGESAQGVWKIRLIDGFQDGVVGQLNAWGLNILGH